MRNATRVDEAEPEYSPHTDADRSTDPDVDASAGWREEYERQHVHPSAGVEERHVEVGPDPQNAETVRRGGGS